MVASACSATWVPWGNARLHIYKRLGCPIHCSCDIGRLDMAVRKNWESHIDASHSRQPLVKGERLVRYELNAVIQSQVQDHIHPAVESTCVHHSRMYMVHVLHQVIHRLLITTGRCRGHDSVTEWLR